MRWDPADVERALERAGLDPRAFDLEATALDLEERSAQNATLDSLVSSDTELDSVSRSDPRWT